METRSQDQEHMEQVVLRWTLLIMNLMVLDYAVCGMAGHTADTVIVQNALPASSYIYDAVMLTCQQHASFYYKVHNISITIHSQVLHAQKQHINDKHIACEESVQLRKLPSVVLIVVVKLIVQVDGRLHLPRCCQSDITRCANTFQLQQWRDFR